MIMKNLNMKRLFSAAAFVVLLAACEEKMQTPIGGDIAGSTISITDADLYPLGDDIEFMVATEGQWSITGIPEWIKIQKENGTTIDNNVGNGAGTFALKLTAEPNSPVSDRQCTLTFVSGNKSKTVTLKQARPYLELTPVGHDYDKDGNLYTIPYKWYERDEYEQTPIFEWEIRSNIPWRIQSEADNSVNAANAKKSNTIDYEALIKAGVSAEWIKYAKAMSGDRDGDWINSYAYLSNEWFELPKGEWFGLSEEEWDDLGSDSGAEDVVRLGFIPESENTGEAKDVLSYYVIPDSDSNLGTVSLQFEQENLKFTIVGDFSEDNERDTYFPAAYMRAKSFTVDCEHPWKLTRESLSDDALSGIVSSDWLSMSSGSGTPISIGTEVGAGVRYLTLDATENPTREIREGWMFVTVEKEGIPVSKSINVLQKEYILQLDRDDARIGNNYTGVFTGNIFSSGEWDYNILAGGRVVSDSESWLNVVAQERDGGVSGTGVYESVNANNFTFNAKGQNLLTSDREVKLRIFAKNNPETLYEEITISQTAFTWNPVLVGDPQGTGVISFGARHDKCSTSTFELNCSSPWEVLVTYDGSEKDWLRFTPESMEGEVCELDKDIISFIPSTDNNLVETKRTATVVVRSKEYAGNSELQKTFKIEQRGANFGLGRDEAKEITLDFGEYEAASQEVGVMSSHPWNLKSNSDASWITVSLPEDCDADGIITISVENNYNMTGRSGKIVLECTSLQKECTININQDAFVFSASPKSFNVPANTKENYIIDLTASAGWSCSSQTDWVHVVDDYYGSMDASIDIFVDGNGTYVTREGTVTIYSNHGGYFETIRFLQDAFVFNTTASSSYSFGPLETTTHNFNVECSGDWGFENKPDWVNLTPGSGEGNGSVTLSVAKNTVRTERSQTVKLYNNLNGDTHSFTVSQSAYVFNNSALNSTAELEAVNPGQRSFSFSCSGDWEVTSDSDWADVSETSGSGANSKTITITFENNPLLVSRTARISVFSKDNTELRGEYSITQKAFVFDTAPVNMAFPNVKATDQSVKMADGTMGAWTAKSDLEWIVVKAPANGNGTGNATVTISVKDNTTLSERSGVVEVASEYVGNNSQLKKVITVTQAAYVFKADVKSLDFAAAATDREVNVECTGAWKATKPDWITLSAASGTGNQKIKVTAAANNGAAREGVLKLESEGNVIEITLKQAAKAE